MNLIFFVFLSLLLVYVAILEHKARELEKLLNSHADYMDEQINHLQQTVERLEFNSEYFGQFEEEARKYLTYIQFHIDAVTCDYYSHMVKYRHLNEELKPVVAQPTLDREFDLAILEQKLIERAKELNIDMNAYRIKD